MIQTILSTRAHIQCIYIVHVHCIYYCQLFEFYLSCLSALSGYQGCSIKNTHSHHPLRQGPKVSSTYVHVHVVTAHVHMSQCWAIFMVFVAVLVLES